MLKDIAISFGWNDDFIDNMLTEGFSINEIEEYILEGNLEQKLQNEYNFF